MIVDREHDNHREIKSVGRCEVVQSFVYLGSCERDSRDSTAHSTRTGGH
ncbi:unnamed protein product, partial [Callosobruchus maculatus]